MSELFTAREQSHATRQQVGHKVYITGKGASYTPPPPPPSFKYQLSRGIVSGLRGAAQGAIDIRNEVASILEPFAEAIPTEARDAIITSLMGFTTPRYDNSVQEVPSLPEVDTTDASIAESLLSGLVQFGAGAAAAPIKGAGMVAQMGRGAVADALFDPEDGNFSTMLKQFGLDNAVLDFLDSQVDGDAGAEERLKARVMQSLEGAGLGALVDGALGALVDGAMAGFRAIRSDEGLVETVRQSLAETGAKAKAAFDAIPVDSNTMYSNPVGVVADAVGKMGSNASETIAVRSEGGLPIAQEKGDNNLRLHLMRLEKMNNSGAVYPGGPKNPRTVIQAPKGTDLPDIVVGNITPDDWQTRIEKSMSTEEIQKAANWYKVVFGEFQKQANGDPKEIARLTDAWFSGQQNSSPGQTLNDVLFVFEQIKRGVPKEELRGKGLPSANRIVIDILTSSKIEGGAGQKIADFLDSGYGKNVRAIMGNKPEGGSPFVVDIHTARDTGLVDETYKNHLTRLGYDVPDGLIADVGGGGINGPQYENRALFGQQLTQHLNNQKWMGRSDWEAAEIQAIGWMQLSGMYGKSNTGGDVVDAFTRNTRRISMEIDPGAGSPLAEKYGADFGALDLDAQRSINNEVTAKAIELVNKQTGITLGSNVHGTGGWELYQNPSTVQQAIASKDTAIEAAARLGYLMQQTEVWVNAPKTMTKNPKHFSIDIVETTGKSLREGKALTNLFDAIIAEEPNELFRGYQPIEIDGKPGIRILITDDAVKASPLTKAKAMAYIQEFSNGKLSEITDRLNFDAEIDIMEADLTRLRNNWEEDKQGGGYKSYFSGQPGKDAATEVSIDGVLNTDGAELERLFSQRIREAQGQRVVNSQIDSSASSNNGGSQ
jgi:hypothetical protein